PILSTLSLHDALPISSGDHVRSVRHRRRQKQLELDLLVAHHIWIRRATGGVFGHHSIDHLLLVLGLKIEDLERNIDNSGGGPSIDRKSTRLNSSHDQI